jgi:hypothetical protein
MFLPQHPGECSALCTDSYTLHLWNNRVVKMELFKRIGPPAGSFLHQIFARTGINSLFRECYPANVMQKIVENTVQKVRRDEGVRKLLQIGVPIVRTAIGRRLGV